MRHPASGCSKSLSPSSSTSSTSSALKTHGYLGTRPRHSQLEFVVGTGGDWRWISVALGGFWWKLACSIMSAIDQSLRAVLSLRGTWGLRKTRWRWGCIWGWFFFLIFPPLYFVSRLESNVHKLIFFIKFQHEKWREKRFRMRTEKSPTQTQVSATAPKTGFSSWPEKMAILIWLRQCAVLWDSARLPERLIDGKSLDTSATQLNSSFCVD